MKIKKFRDNLQECLSGTSCIHLVGSCHVFPRRVRKSTSVVGAYAAKGRQGSVRDLPPKQTQLAGFEVCADLSPEKDTAHIFLQNTTNLARNFVTIGDESAGIRSFSDDIRQITR